ncbi:hypothetical protein GGI35DRAFT_455203 [Trichoderma velutinum]
MDCAKRLMTLVLLARVLSLGWVPSKYRCYAQTVKWYMIKYLPIEIDTTRYDSTEESEIHRLPFRSRQCKVSALASTVDGLDKLKGTGIGGAIELDGEAWVRLSARYSVHAVRTCVLCAAHVLIHLYSILNKTTSWPRRYFRRAEEAPVKRPPSKKATFRARRNLSLPPAIYPLLRNYRRTSNLFLSAFRAPIQQAADKVIGPWQGELEGSRRI